MLPLRLNPPPLPCLENHIFCGPRSLGHSLTKRTSSNYKSYSTGHDWKLKRKCSGSMSALLLLPCRHRGLTGYSTPRSWYQRCFNWYLSLLASQLRISRSGKYLTRDFFNIETMCYTPLNNSKDDELGPFLGTVV